jgi:hypothetical protein
MNPNIIKWYSHFESWYFVKSQFFGEKMQIINTIQIEPPNILLKRFSTLNIENELAFSI